MIVRLKGNVENILNILIKKFQFYDSPIKRLYDNDFKASQNVSIL